MRLPFPDLPTNRVIHLGGITIEEFAVAVDPLPENAPVILTLRITEAADPSHAVSAALDAMESVARAQLRAWLPAADQITGTSDLDRRTVRRLARETAATTELFGPYLADIAESALVQRPVATRYDADTRADSLAAILVAGYRREAVVLALWSADPAPLTAQQAMGTAAHWLAGRGIGVWVLGDGVVEPGRFPTITLAGPTEVSGSVAPEVGFPVLAGRPHPGSAVEHGLELRLARHSWARGRTWNQVYQSHPLSPPIRVDLMWPAEQVVVELDGPDHRGIVKYSDDRRRDNTLTLGGYAVLRFTNNEVTGDLSRVLAMIEQLLATRRDERISG